MSALEAILWAQDYPEEGEAIVGLDMALPATYDGFDLDGALKYEKLAVIGRELGLIRFYYSDSMLSPALSKEDKKLYRAIACEKAVNQVVQNEGLAIPGACEKINSKPIPDIPTLLFVSNGKEVGVENWAELQKEYASKLTDASVVELSCGHYVHNFEYKKISEDMIGFVEGLE